MGMDGLTCSCTGCLLRPLFFENVSPEELAVICDAKYEVLFKKGDIIAEEGQAVENFMYLKEGLIKVFRKTADGGGQIISIARPMDFISTMAVISSDKYPYSVSAIEDSVICNIRIGIIKELIKRNGQFALNILGKVSIAADNVIKLRMDLSKRQLKGRIAYMLLYFAENIYNKNEFDLPLSRKEIAELIGMTIENVIRTLSEFRKDKIIVINGKTITILNAELLTKISDHG